MFVFLFRRILIVYLALFFTKLLGMQILIQLYVNLLVFVYIGTVRPFKTFRKNKEELLNEAMIYMLTIIVTIFSDFCPVAEARYNIGWGYILINIVNILLKFGGVFQRIVRYIKLRIIRFKNKYKIFQRKKEKNPKNIKEKQPKKKDKSKLSDPNNLATAVPTPNNYDFISSYKLKHKPV